MTDLNDMSLEKFKLWTINALRVFLALRKKQLTGSFDELAARAFCAWEEKIAVDTNAEHEQRKLLAEYQEKLKFTDESVSDPLSLKSDWLNEKAGMEFWPAVYITDISKYLNTKNPDDLINRLLNEYKEGKAYRYFSGEWVKEVMYQTLGEKGDKCVLKARITPSQAVKSKAYTAWVIIRQEFGGLPGGEVLSAYCTCTAGMLGSCNHIAGVLFKIEHAVKTGMTKTSCTSKPSQWNRPAAKTAVKLGKANSFIWKKSSYLKNTNEIAEHEKKNKRQAFTPLSKFQQERKTKPDHFRTLVYENLKEDIPNSCFVLTVEKKRILCEGNKQTQIPLTLSELSEKMSCSQDIPLEDKMTLFMDALQITEQQVQDLATATVDQSDSGLWKNQRRGRVTASLFHRVCSRVKSLQKDESEDPSSVVSLVMGTRESVQTTAMKHGLSLEPHAKKSYISLMKGRHKGFQGISSGMYIYQEKPFMSATPDLLVNCKCCGEGLCEIKCPESIKDKAPSAENVPYLVMSNDGTVFLKNKHPYFYQIQGQLGITKRKYCDFFVFTYHGSVSVRVEFEEEFFAAMVNDLSWFWQRYVLKEILTASCKKAQKASKEITYD